MMPHDGQILDVRLHGMQVGTLQRRERNGFVFQYHSQYLRRADAVPLSHRMPCREEPFSTATTERWFDALLPEGLRRERLARLVGAHRVDTWTLLVAAGAECAGAVQVLPPEHRHTTPYLHDLSDEGLSRLLEPPTEPIAQIGRAARISIAGAQDKLVLFRHPEGRWAVPMHGHPSTHILKPRHPDLPALVQNEHWCMEVTRLAGLDVATTHIETVQDREVLVIERYDRRRGAASGAVERLHQEDLAQALGARAKYQAEGGPSTYDFFGVPGIDRDALFDRLMMNWLLGNCDAHAKNYSVLEPGTRSARLAPAYDVVSTEAYPELDRTLATATGRAKHLNAVDGAAIEALGARVGFVSGEGRQRLRELAERARNAMRALREAKLDPGPVPTDKIAERIDATRRW